MIAGDRMERVEQVEVKKKSRKRRRFETDLPAPPPDPASKEETSSQEEAAAAALNAEDAFAHLSKLYSLVEQIVDIRDRNSKLFNRVRQLERIKATKKANSELEKSLTNGQDVQLLDEDVGFAESLLGAMLSSGFEPTRRTSNISRASSGTRRGGSLSVSVEQRRVSCPIGVDATRSSSARPAGRSSHAERKKRASLVLSMPKVSKWTRVKAAFKWEKAACNTADVLLDADVAVRFLKIPEGQVSEVSGPPTPVGTISSSSSIDDVFHRSHRSCSNQSRARREERGDVNDSDPSRRSHSLDGETLVPVAFNYAQRGKDLSNNQKGDYRIPKTPWGKMKDIMQLRRDSLGRQVSRNSRNEDNHSTSSLDSTDVHKTEDGRIPRVRITSDPSGSSLSPVKSKSHEPESLDLATRRLTPTLTITVPSSEELRSLSSPESITPPLRQSSDRSDKFSIGDGTRDKSGQVSPASSSSGILRYGLGRSKTSQAFPQDFKRQTSKGDSLGSSPKMQRRNSKWNKVKRAFLTSATSVPTSPSRTSYFFDDGDATGGSYSASASAEDLDNDNSSNPAIQAEIQRNYRLLHDKLGTEFYRKLSEWEKLKSTSPSPNPKDSPRSPRDKDCEHLRLLGEENLTPEFKKKLEEWKRMGKGAAPAEPRSINRRRITDWQIWRSPSKTETKQENSGRLSDEFVKKMEEWKRIKAATKKDEEHDVKRPETEEEEEIEEKIVNELSSRTKFSERFKPWRGLEDEEFKSLDKVLSLMEKDRQTRLSKLHRVVGSAPERTQEVLIHTSTGLYRFEGISRQFTRKLYEWEKSQGIAPEYSTFRLLDPLRYGISSRPRLAPASTAVEGKPPRVLGRSKSVGSVHLDAFSTTTTKISSRRPSSLSLNDLETLETRSCLVGSVPTLPDEEDTSEDIALEDSEQEPEAEPEAMIVDIEDVIEETASPMTKYQPHQTPVYSVAGSETTSIAIPLGTVTSRHEPSPVILFNPDDILPITAQACMVEEAEEDVGVIRISEVTSRFQGGNEGNPNCSIEAREECGVIGGWMDQERDGVGSVDNSWVVAEKFSSSNERRVAAHDNGSAKDETPLPHNTNRTEEDDDSVTEVVITVASNSRNSRKYLKTRRLTDTQIGYVWHNNKSPEPDSNNSLSSSAKLRKEPELIDDYLECCEREKIIINENTLNKIVVPTSSGTISTGDSVSVTLKLKNEEDKKEKRDPRSVFVKTKRIVFSPFRRPKQPVIAPQPEVPEVPPEVPRRPEKTPEKIPVPQSPVPARKEYKAASPKETAPSIRMMIKKYNEKLEASSSIAPGSATSSGSGSPLWRSPVSERRIRSRMEKYQEEVRKAIAGPLHRANVSGIAKSSTIDFVRNSGSGDDVQVKNSVVRSETAPQIPQAGATRGSNESTSLRALMIKRAKEDFLHRNTQSVPHDNEKTVDMFEEVQTHLRADLVKSASAGMINIDPDAFERIQSSDSLNKNCDSMKRPEDLRDKCKESRLQQIASKFKRARLRRSRDKEMGSMSTVSMLCRQSLLVDIANVGTSKSCPTTPSPQYDEEMRSNLPRTSK